MGEGAIVLPKKSVGGFYKDPISSLLDKVKFAEENRNNPAPVVSEYLVSYIKQIRAAVDSPEMKSFPDSAQVLIRLGTLYEEDSHNNITLRFDEAEARSFLAALKPDLLKLQDASAKGMEKVVLQGNNGKADFTRIVEAVVGKNAEREAEFLSVFKKDTKIAGKERENYFSNSLAWTAVHEAHIYTHVKQIERNVESVITRDLPSFPQGVTTAATITPPNSAALPIAENGQPVPQKAFATPK